ncbi:DEAD/DEAH box helicase [Desulfovibrio sp. JC010]|uniref:DEAD/DEAH box helicase n=1 Tax=Desulfovibrio sp. JC010 TaxID=2593641 RepID=UPI0013D38B58|nr:DEAD/DEAH box helicase [Desulfovibrio sp. JC010]NDV25701.1 DEAD/DEAH box helicase [Desulfovibrio sp. JC010]
MGFDQFNFDMRLVSGIRSVGYEEPTPVQLKAVPAVLAGRDVMGLAQTGTGKTAAFVLPVLQRLLDGEAEKRGPVRVLVLSPTRELALQTHESFIELGRQTGIRSAAVYGGAGIGKQAKEVKKVTVVNATPGRLLDLLERGDLDLSQVDTLVLDEADRMLDMGFMDEVANILEKLPAKRQNLMFSATMPDEIDKLSKNILHDPEVIRVAVTVSADGVFHYSCPVPLHLKQSFLKVLLNEIEFSRVLVFVRTKRWARRLAQRLVKSGLSAADLHGDLSQSKRNRTLSGFKFGDFKVLVATDLAARGIDCSNISHVINYDMPDNVEIFVHRTGRTGRADAKGTAYTFVADEDKTRLAEIEEALGYGLELFYLDKFNYNAPKPDFIPADENKGRKKRNSQSKK